MTYECKFISNLRFEFDGEKYWSQSEFLGFELKTQHWYSGNAIFVHACFSKQTQLGGTMLLSKSFSSLQNLDGYLRELDSLIGNTPGAMAGIWEGKSYREKTTTIIGTDY